MGEHYYTSQPTTKHEFRLIETTLVNEKFIYETDAGVFSKKSLDFGTEVLLEALTFEKTGMKVADIGCGYGPIGIFVAKKQPSAKITMVDLNERAVELAKRNAKRNGVEQSVDIFTSFLMKEIVPRDYDMIISNPPIRAGKQTVHQLFEEAHEHLASDGELWIVIQKKQGAPSAIEKLQQLFDEVTTVVKKKGYYIIKAKKN